MGAYGYVGVVPAGRKIFNPQYRGLCPPPPFVPRSILRVIDPTEPLVEEVVERLVDVIRLAHYHRVALNGTVADSSDSVDLLQKREPLNQVLQYNMSTYLL